MGLYSFIKTNAGKLGIGVADLAYQRSHNPPRDSVTGTGLLVQRPLVTLSGAGFVTKQNTLTVSGLGDAGLGFSGALRLTPLAQVEGDK